MEIIVEKMVRDLDQNNFDIEKYNDITINYQGSCCALTPLTSYCPALVPLCYPITCFFEIW